VSRTIENAGSLHSKNGSIGLAAGEEVLIRPAKDTFFIRPLRGDGEIINRGDLQVIQVELQSASNPYSLAIRQSGRIEAVEQEGRIYLKAIESNILADGALIAEGGSIEVEGRSITLNDLSVNTSGEMGGGTIHIVGENLNISQDATFRADARCEGDGGSIYLIGEDSLSFEGSAFAQGGHVAGDGGFIEVSGYKSFSYHPKSISTRAPCGLTGTLLLDPNDIIIQLLLATSGGFLNPYKGVGFSPALLKISDLVGAAGLLNNNVTVQTDALTGGGLGDITIQDAFSWASANLLTLLPSRDLLVNAVMEATGIGGAITATAGRNINVGSATSIVPSAIQTNTGPITLTAAQNLNVIGGGTAGATSLIKSTSGAITATITGNVTLGNAFSINPSEISSITGNVSFPNTGGALSLIGGNVAGAYAQIGVGTVPGSTAISSSISFPALNGDVTLTGGSADNCYVQIGHAPNGPGTSSVSGDITFPATGTNGALTMTGGSSDSSSAIIGHGNELSTNLGTVSGTLDIEIADGITLQGGSANRCHAIIGFHNPQGGSVANFSCTSPSVTVMNLVMNDITLNAATGNNAVIGYYNNSIVGNGPTATISLIDVEIPTNLKINLNGGDSAAIGHGVASIGTLTNLGTAPSAINISTGFLNLNTIAPTGDGSARIINSRPTTSVPFDVTINCQNVGDIANLLGGTTSTSNFAEVYSGQNLNFTYGVNGNLVVNNTMQSGFTQMRANQNIFLNRTSLGGRTILAGSSLNATGYALMQALNGAVQLGTANSSGGTDITIGDATSQAYSRIISESGACILNSGGGSTFTMNGGTGAGMPTAEVRGNSATISINYKDMLLTGGSGNLAYAQIGSTSGDVTINLSHNLTLTGGSATQAYAQIGKGYITTETGVTSTLNFPLIEGSVVLQGGSAVGAYAQIGHSPFNNLGSLDTTGNIDFTPSGIEGTLTLIGGSATNATAILGHGNELSANLSTCTGNIIDLTVTNNILLQTGVPAQTHAIIGFHNPTGGSSYLFSVVSNNPGIEIDCTSGTMMLNAGNGSNATIGYYNASNGGNSASVLVSEIGIICNNNITLQAGNDGGTKAGGAAIGTLADAGSTSRSAIKLSGTTVSLLGPTGGLIAGNDGSARLVNNLPNTSAAFDVNLTVTDLLVYGGTGKATGFADVYSSQNLNCTFSNNCEINNTILQNGYAHMVSYSDMSLGFTGSQLSVIGGALFSADALIESVMGQITEGSFSGSGALTVIVGQANSLSTSQIVTHPGRMNINSGNNMTIQGGAALNCVSLIRTDSGNFTVSAGGNMSITGGTGGANASAEIRSLSGTGRVASNLNMSLLGGGSTLCFAQINSDTGPITFTNIGNNLSLTGGSGTQCYAQIGKGSVSAATRVASALTFNEISNNVTLTGGSGDTIYVQIGHSPFVGIDPINVFGDINLSRVGGTLTLNGGTGLRTTAIIGHGNEFTPQLATCNASINVFDSGLGGIALNPGTTLLDTHAVISFHSPKAGPAVGVTFDVLSNQIDVETTFGPIQVNGGIGENAIIGYYNANTPATMPPGVNVNLGNITVDCSPNALPTNNITLQAGNTAAAVNGVAVIGSFVAAGSSAQSTINITGNLLNVFGPTGTNDGQALVLNNTIGSILNRSITLVTNTITVRGGASTSATGRALAEIYSSGTMISNFKTALNLGIDPTSIATLQTANSLIRAFSDITMNQSGSTGIMTLLGGASSPILSDISSFAGGILIGDPNGTTGAANISIGRSDMIGSARLYTVTGNVTAHTSGNLLITGGNGAAALSEMHGNGALTFTAKGSATLLGGNNAGAIGRLSSSSNALRAAAQKGITLTGSTGFAEIRNFGFENELTSVASGADVTLNIMSRILNAGNGPTTVGAEGNLILNSDGLIQSAGNGGLKTFSGVSTFLNDTSQILSGGGQLSVVVDNLFPTPPGSGGGSFNSQSNARLINNGPVRIFTAKREQNNIQSLINNNAFVPGPAFIDSTTEKWNTYYYSNYGGTPFTIFYKGFIPNVIPTFVLNGIANAEFTHDLLTFDNLIIATHEMRVLDDTRAKNKTPRKIISETKYRFIRELYRDYNLKRLDRLN
jgi:hypothetical protein